MTLVRNSDNFSAEVKDLRVGLLKLSLEKFFTQEVKYEDKRVGTIEGKNSRILIW